MTETLTDHQPTTVYVGGADCLERDCEEYVTEDGENNPGVGRCSHITTEQVCIACSTEEPDGFYKTTVAWPCPPSQLDPACTAGLLPRGSGPVDRCVVRGLHDDHRTAAGVRWTDADSGVR